MRQTPFVVLIFAILALFCTQSPVGAQEAGRVLKATISQSQNLPPAMYGTWSIQATVTATTAPPWLFTPSTSEVWTLVKDNGVVVLKNVSTQASASIHVDKVQGNTATFHHEARIPSRRMRIIETPTVTVSSNSLTGVNRQTLFFYRDDKLAETYTLDIQIQGTRLSGAAVQFGDADDRPAPKFQVEPMRFQN